MADVDLGVMNFDEVEAINNADIINLVSWIDTGIRQFARAPSASRTDTQAADLDICDAWVSRFKQYFTHFSGQPELYLPKAHPKSKPLPKAPENIHIVQNPVLQMMLYQLSHMRTELLYCESAERLNGFHKSQADVAITPWITKQELFLSEARKNLQEPQKTWFPEADLQEPGVNAGEPR